MHFEIQQDIFGQNHFKEQMDGRNCFLFWSIPEGPGHILWILASVSDDWNFIETEVACQNTCDVLLELYSDRKPDNNWTSNSLEFDAEAILYCLSLV